MNKPTHKHTHLQAAQSQRTDQSLQKSVLFANAQPTDIKSDREKGQQITAVWQNGGFSANSTAVLRLNFCAKPNICASISATSPSCKTL